MTPTATPHRADCRIPIFSGQYHLHVKNHPPSQLIAMYRYHISRRHSSKRRHTAVHLIHPFLQAHGSVVMPRISTEDFGGLDCRQPPCFPGSSRCTDTAVLKSWECFPMGIGFGRGFTKAKMHWYPDLVINHNLLVQTSQPSLLMEIGT